ncbi:MAG: toxin-activating lysine-acyltransferase [Polaromonas sp.]|nr:toxin-activating lysine-acyltransferase [Polaromonas sp.]
MGARAQPQDRHGHQRGGQAAATKQGRAVNGHEGLRVACLWDAVGGVEVPCRSAGCFSVVWCATARRYCSPPHQLTTADWSSGDQIWLIDVFTPFGGAQDVLKDLREKVFSGQTVHQLAPVPGACPKCRRDRQLVRPPVKP